MGYAIFALLYVGLGHLVGEVIVRLSNTTFDSSWEKFIHMALWWVLWPLGLVLVLAQASGGWITRRLNARHERSRYGLGDPVRIRELELELGMASSTSIALTSAPRKFPSLAGTSADACQLPIMRSALKFDLRYGQMYYNSIEDADGRKELEVALAQLEDLTDDFEEESRSLAGQGLLDAGEAVLRRIGRVETAIEPVFAGLSFASYGRARKACIEARSGVGNILDRRAQIGDFQL